MATKGGTARKSSAEVRAETAKRKRVDEALKVLSALPSEFSEYDKAGRVIDEGIDLDDPQSVRNRLITHHSVPAHYFEDGKGTQGLTEDAQIRLLTTLETLEMRDAETARRGREYGKKRKHFGGEVGTRKELNDEVNELLADWPELPEPGATGRENGVREYLNLYGPAGINIDEPRWIWHRLAAADQLRKERSLK